MFQLANLTAYTLLTLSLVNLPLTCSFIRSFVRNKQRKHNTRLISYSICMFKHLLEITYRFISQRDKTLHYKHIHMIGERQREKKTQRRAISGRAKTLYAVVLFLPHFFRFVLFFFALHKLPLCNSKICGMPFFVMNLAM